jgi:hypothetical protein
MVQEKVVHMSKKFKSELKKALFTALIAAFGFLIALVWRDVIQSYVDTIVSISPVQGQLISAGIVTIIAVVGIMIVTAFLDEKVDKK